PPRRPDRRLRRSLRRVPRTASHAPARSREPRHGHRRGEGSSPPALARRLPSRVLDAPRRRRLPLRQRARHDGALLPALLQRARRSLRRTEPRPAPAPRPALAPHARGRSGYAGTRPARRDGAPVPPRPRQRRLRVGGADRGPRPHGGRRRDRGHGPGRRRTAARLRPLARRAGIRVTTPAQVPEIETGAGLHARIEAAARARSRLVNRPLTGTVASLAAAATAWREDTELARALPSVARLDPTMVAALLPLVAEALDADAMAALVESELGTRASARPAPTEVALVAHVLASNVPALALPAIALSCLTGAAVGGKSGRADRVSRLAFQRALAAVDPDLAATVVTAYWPGRAPPLGNGLLARSGAPVP